MRTLGRWGEWGKQDAKVSGRGAVSSEAVSWRQRDARREVPVVRLVAYRGYGIAQGLAGQQLRRHPEVGLLVLSPRQHHVVTREELNGMDYVAWGAAGRARQPRVPQQACGEAWRVGQRT